MPTSRAARELRRKPCTCGQGTVHWDPHHEGCAKYIDRSSSKAIREALIAKRHSEIEGEWVNLAEFHQIDLFSFHAWGEWPDRKQEARTGMPRGTAFYRRVSYEIKVSRADFRREIRNPHKRALAMAISHQFFFATPPGLVKRDEIPDDCGLVYVSPDGTVKVVKHAPIRRPERALTTGDVVALLRARHLGPSAYAYRDQARRASGLLKQMESEYERTQALLKLARVRLLREKGSLLVAGSEWVGPWPWRDATPPEETRVLVTNVSVYDGYDEPDSLWRSGTVYAKPVAKVEADGHYFGTSWMDAGDFLIAFRHESEPKKVAPPERTSLDRPPKLVAVEGDRLDDNIAF